MPSTPAVPDIAPEALSVEAADLAVPSLDELAAHDQVVEVHAGEFPTPRPPPMPVQPEMPTPPPPPPEMPTPRPPPPAAQLEMPTPRPPPLPGQPVLPPLRPLPVQAPAAEVDALELAAMAGSPSADEVERFESPALQATADVVRVVPLMPPPRASSFRALLRRSLALRVRRS